MNNKAMKTSSAGGRSLLFAGTITVVVAVVANLVTRALLLAHVDLPDDFPARQAASIALFTALGVVATSVIFALTANRSAQPARAFTRVALLAFVLSIIPNVILATNPQAAPFPGATASGFLALTIFHLVAALVSVMLLPRLARR